MTQTQGAVLHVSPHPDDELLGAPAALMGLRDAGWRVVNFACSLGRPADVERRRAELTEACRRAGFELMMPGTLAAIGLEDDLQLAQAHLTAEIGGAIESCGAGLLIGPSPHDGHHGHEVVGRAIVAAVEARGEPAEVMFWGLWRDLPSPNVLYPFDADRLTEIDTALAAHAGELQRSRYDRLLEARAAANAVLGPERVFGYGSRGIAAEYADLLMNVSWTSEDGWRQASPRVLDPRAPLHPTREEIAEAARQPEHEDA